MRFTSLGMLIAVCSSHAVAETPATSSASESLRGRLELVHGDAPSKMRWQWPTTTSSFPTSWGINLMFNEVLNCVGVNCFAWGSAGWTVVADGTSRVYHQTWLPPWAYNNQNAMAHEMGHGFGIPHSLCATSANFWEKIEV